MEGDGGGRVLLIGRRVEAPSRIYINSLRQRVLNRWAAMCDQEARLTALPQTPDVVVEECGRA